MDCGPENEMDDTRGEIDLGRLWRQAITIVALTRLQTTQRNLPSISIIQDTHNTINLVIRLCYHVD